MKKPEQIINDYLEDKAISKDLRLKDYIALILDNNPEQLTIEGFDLYYRRAEFEKR